MGLFGIFGNKKTSLIGSGVLMGARDSHTHILPGVDDGVQTLVQSLEILAFVETVGITELWCTPHIMDDVPNRTEALKERFSGLCAAYRGPIKLRLAAEYMLDQEYEERLANDDILTMDEARAIMRIGRNSMLNALQEGTIPAAKVGRQWRISKRALMALLSGQKTA